MVGAAESGPNTSDAVASNARAPTLTPLGSSLRVALAITTLISTDVTTVSEALPLSVTLRLVVYLPALLYR